MGRSGLGTPRDCVCPGGPPASPGGVRPVGGNVETKPGTAHPAADVQGRFLLFLTPVCQEKEGIKARVDGRAAECAPCTLPGSARARNAPAFAFKTGLGDTEMNGETQAGPGNVPFCFTWSKLKTNERTSEKPSKRTNSVSSRERDRGGRERLLGHFLLLFEKRAQRVRPAMPHTSCSWRCSQFFYFASPLTAP